MKLLFFPGTWAIMTLLPFVAFCAYYILNEQRWHSEECNHDSTTDLP